MFAGEREGLGSRLRFRYIEEKRGGLSCEEHPDGVINLMYSKGHFETLAVLSYSLTSDILESTMIVLQQSAVA